MLTSVIFSDLGFDPSVKQASTPQWHKACTQPVPDLRDCPAQHKRHTSEHLPAASGTHIRLRLLVSTWLVKCCCYKSCGRVQQAGCDCCHLIRSDLVYGLMEWFPPWPKRQEKHPHVFPSWLSQVMAVDPFDQLHHPPLAHQGCFTIKKGGGYW